MNEQLDDDLKKRITEVFETVESAGAEEGWLLLREKFPEEKRNRKAIIWFWWGAAAILLLFLGVGLRYLNEKNQPENYATKKIKSGDKINRSITQDAFSDNKVKTDKEKDVKKIRPGDKVNLTIGRNAFSDDNKTKIAEEQAVKKVKTGDKVNLAITRSAFSDNNKAKIGKEKAVKARENDRLSLTKGRTRGLTAQSLAKTKSFDKTKTVNRAGIKNYNSNVSSIIALKNDKSKNVFENPIADSDSSNDNDIADNKMHDAKITGQNVIASTDTPAAKVKNAAPKQPEKTINTMFAEDEKKKDQKNLEKNKKVRLGIYEATYFNYAKGSSNNINVGAGLTANINISKHLELLAGVAVGQNTLSFDSNNINIAGASQTYLAATQFSTSNGRSASSLPFNNFTPATTFKNYSADLVGLDLPLNLKYLLNSQKNELYISAGFSSGTFVSETYAYKYYYSASSSPYLQQTQQQSSNKSFNSFYFAKTLNLSLGEGLPFGKNMLTIEPFLKYPLGGLGSQNIHFGAGGINLKFNLLNGKK